MSRKYIFLMGAPTLENLKWDEDELLHAPIPPFNGQNVCDGGHRPASSAHSVKWRLLQDRGSTAGISSSDIPGDREAIFFTTRDLAATTEHPTCKAGGGTSSAETEDQVLSQFYDHSFTIHETSRVSLRESLDIEPSHESSAWTDSTGISIRTQGDNGDASEVCFPPMRGNFSDLKDIPNAAYLRSILPQTMTVNLIVGVIAVYPPRRVLTRPWKRELDIVELIVADETKAGFGVTVWLAPAEQIKPAAGGRIEQDALGKAIAGLRPRDIVLLRTVGLSSFRERVYGQSLRRGLTQIDLLHRQPVDRTDSGGIYTSRAIHAARNDAPRLMKIRRVREWIWNFVGSGPDEAGGDGGMFHAHARPVLPPDTP